ncbi:MAG: peptide chain release factor N(5)-glutamine methyltransferase [Dokdonella sp.]
MNDAYRNLRERIAGALQFLPDKPEETADSTLHALWHAAAGDPKSAGAALAAGLATLDAEGLQRLEDLVQRRLHGIPLAHLVGRQHFLGMEMLAGPDALVPRKETELLAGAAIDLARGLAAARSPLTVIDVCTGSGNVALALARHVAEAQVYGSDLSAEAIALANRNAEHLGLGARAQFRVGDLLGPFDTPQFHAQVDLLTCNPPYISSAKVGQMAEEISAHEPRLAFDGGPLGVAILSRLLDEATRFVRRGGWLAFEVGLGQGRPLVKRLQNRATFQEVRALEDADGAIRTILARL